MSGDNHNLKHRVRDVREALETGRLILADPNLG